jgi:hypothetical protein
LVLHNFFFHKQNIHRRYKEFFGITDQDLPTDGEGDEGISKMGPKEVTARFYFRATLELCQEDITKIRVIDNLPIYICLNTLSVFKDRREQERKEIEKMKQKSKQWKNM